MTAPDTTLDGVLTVADVAADLQIGHRRAADLFRLGVVPGFKIGRDWRVSRTAYAQWKVDQAKIAARRAALGSRWSA